MTNTAAELEALTRRAVTALQAAGLTVATAESCTGGWLAKVLTDLPGSSGSFGWGVVCYSDAAKRALLQIPAALLEQHGAVSEPVVLAMAQAARHLSDAAFGIAISGIAGPDGGTPDKPIGTVWIAWAGPKGSRAQRHALAGDRAAVRRQSVACALEGLLAELERRSA
jgi:nicotinamide-nucleotide amidase